MSAETSTVVPPPLFSTEPVVYIGLRSYNPDGSTHLFIVDQDAFTRYSGTVNDLVKTTAEFEAQIQVKVEGELSDDPASQNIDNLVVFDFKNIDKQSMDYCVMFPFWKKRFCNVVTERIPDFIVPSSKEEGVKFLIASNDLRL